MLIDHVLLQVLQGSNVDRSRVPTHNVGYNRLSDPSSHCCFQEEHLQRLLPLQFTGKFD